MTPQGEASREDSERQDTDRIRDLAERTRIPSGLALALILKYGNEPNVLDREAAKFRRDAKNGGRQGAAACWPIPWSSS
ncbi:MULTISPECIES: hypothetical protein [unclassified Mesorhizobium]|uniref:hypothetical protein n=1 Tax=unclassified Mesorhizobium TaxID=325217 RepID=UPI001129F21B|nr:MULTISPECIES: hypothetical protein [unclassified Mesorhizobium]MBZ9814415.1 hypothetical protein [Mesorhizobium sp. CA7]TPI76733.1 hypothetical protein FJ423_20580 [Mesorhizobium sp. B2-8-9]